MKNKDFENIRSQAKPIKYFSITERVLKQHFKFEKI